jgi:uncharacterized membrane protein
MSIVVDDTTAVVRPDPNWSAIFAGALAAASLAIVLHGFAAAVGLAVSSTSPTWRDGSMALWLLSGLYLVLVALASYGLGGYVAGWVRSWSSIEDGVTDPDITNGIHGLIVWAVATLMTALMIGAAAFGVSQLATPANSSAGPSFGSQNIIAYDIDRLLRSDGRAQAGDHQRARNEAGRILLTASGHSGVSSDDRQYLIRLVAAQTNLGAPEAERRVDETIVRARDSIRKARRSAVIVGFMTAAAVLLGAAAAWFAAGAGARHGRDPTVASIWTWRLGSSSTAAPTASPRTMP